MATLIPATPALLQIATFTIKEKNHKIAMMATMLALLIISGLGHAADKDRNRETNKLKPIPKEELPLQALTDIYSGCINASLRDDIKNGKTTLSLGEVRNICQEERKNLSQKMSPDGINSLDNLFVSTYNDYQSGERQTIPETSE
ncbi:MAG: hypothetical protein M0Q95_06310 [Porticoccaceae bacterium]|nr:hypothetical protein [Porticoccaceae bacterium]